MVEVLKEHIAAARHVAIEPNSAHQFGRGDYEAREWRGNDILILRLTTTAMEVRYVRRHPGPRSWEHSFKPDLTDEELHGWLMDLC
jgi:hypothetical protein